MKKIAFIIVRYGENINGGAEVHCQMLAERLLPYYEVEVLTTTIRAFNHPDQDYTEGVSSWNGVRSCALAPCKPSQSGTTNDIACLIIIALRIPTPIASDPALATTGPQAAQAPARRFACRP